MKTKNTSVHAFTLVELLTVIAIIGVLAAILIPVIGKVRSSARDAVCLSNLRQIGTAITLYTSEHPYFPPGATKSGALGYEGITGYWTTVLAPYFSTSGTSSARAWYDCPSKAFKTATPANSYSCNRNLMPDNQYSGPNPLVRIEKVTRPSQVVIVMDGAQARESDGYTDPLAMSFPYGINPEIYYTMFDNKDLVWGGQPRFRHRGNRFMNVVYVDGHAGSIENGKLKYGNINP